MKKILSILIVFLVLGGMIFAQGQKKGGDVTVGFSVWTMEFTFFQAIEKGVRDACKDLGYKYIMIDQNGKADKMVNDLNNLVAQKVTGLVITPVDPNGIGPAVVKARAAGIPVVCADIGKTGPVNALVISNNRRGGELAMEYVDKLLKKKGITGKKVGVARASPQFTYSHQRGEGFVAKAKQLGYTVATDLVLQNLTAEGGFDIMQQMMSAAPDLNAVFFISGREAVGAANAVKAAGKNIIVVGYNGDPEEMQAMKDGLEAATIAQQPYNIGYHSVELLKKIFEGAKYENADEWVDVALVTPDTMDAFQQNFDAQMKK
jgi:ribose transport system substrate-binding protein